MAVGGTGQLVLQHWLQLYFLGQLKRLRFRAVVVDTNALNETLRAQAEFLDLLRIGSQEDVLLTRAVPKLEYVRPTLPLEHSTVSAGLTNMAVDRLPVEHPARTYFAHDVLDMQVADGMYGRPALKAVLADEWRLTPALSIGEAQRVVVVGSVVGGTGGGLIVPLLDQMCDEKTRSTQLQVRAVLFGQWFRAKEGYIDADDKRFLSNQVLALGAIRELGARLRAFGVVGPDGPEGRVDRDPHQETKTLNVPWPQDRSHPLWQGTRLLYHMVTDKTREGGTTFETLDVPPEALSANDPPVLEAAKNDLRRRLPVAAALVHQGAVRSMGADPLARKVWGDGFVNTVSDMWHAAQICCGGHQLRAFPRDIQTHLAEAWELLSSTFPRERLPRARVSDIREVGWPRIQLEAIRSDALGGRELAVKRFSAMLLWLAMGGAE